MAVRIEHGRLVRLAYTIKDKDGRVLEDVKPDEAYTYVQGDGEIVAPVERALEGKTAGFQIEVTVQPRDAYGEYDASLVAELPRTNFRGEVEVGMRFNTTGPAGKPLTVRVIEVEDDIVTIDGNHPLAGLELIFDVKVLDVSQGSASAEDDDEDDENQGSGTLH